VRRPLAHDGQHLDEAREVMRQLGEDGAERVGPRAEPPRASSP
jgi:hypothetical protein